MEDAANSPADEHPPPHKKEEWNKLMCRTFCKANSTHDMTYLFSFHIQLSFAREIPLRVADKTGGIFPYLPNQEKQRVSYFSRIVFHWRTP